MRLLLVFILLTPFAAYAQSEMVTGAATPQEVYQKVSEAAIYLSTNGENGLKEFQNPTGRFVWKNTHVAVTKCIDNYCLPGPKSKDVGLNMSKLKCYKTGKFYILELCNEAMYDPKGAWTEHWQPRPGFKEVQRKVSFMMPAANTPYQVVSGIYDNSTTLEELKKFSDPKEVIK